MSDNTEFLKNNMLKYYHHFLHDIDDRDLVALIDNLCHYTKTSENQSEMMMDFRSNYLYPFIKKWKLNGDIHNYAVLPEDLKDVKS